MPATKHIAKKDQSLVDIAITNYGNNWINGLLHLIEYNDVNLADELVPSTELEVNGVDENDLGLRYLKARGIEIACGGGKKGIVTVNDLTLLALTSTSIKLSWTDKSEYETAMILVRSTSEDFSTDYTEIELPPDAEMYLDEDLTTGLTYYYKLIVAGDLLRTVPSDSVNFELLPPMFADELSDLNDDGYLYDEMIIP